MQFMSSMESVLQSHELSSYVLWATDPIQQSTPQDIGAYVSGFASSDIFIAVPTSFDASDSISFFELGDAEQTTDMHFSIDIPIKMAPADFNLDIDAERAAVFYTTVIGMEFPLDNMFQSVDSMPRLDLRRNRERLSAGRMICLLKQQLNL
jgi:hypothetical protein